MIKGVIFDVGGVLAHDVWESLYADIARRYRLSAPVLHRAGRRLWMEYDRRAGDPGELEREYWGGFLRRVRGLPASVTIEGLMEMSDRYIRAVDGPAMRRILLRLKRKGLRLALCSNNNEFWFPRQYYWLGLDEFFDEDKVVLSCREGIVKAPGDFRMFLAAARRLSLAPQHCLVIDDREHYLKGAGRCGLRTILFGATLDKQLRALGL